MRMLRAWALRLLSVFGRKRAEDDFSAQLEADIEMYIEDAMRAGMSAEEARRAALLRFGGVDSTKEAWRDGRSVPILETLVRDVSYAIRVMGRNKGWTTVAVASLALGVGANATIFGAANRLLIQKLSIPAADELVVLRWKGENRAFTGILDYGYVPGGFLSYWQDPNFSVFDSNAGATGAYATFERMKAANETLDSFFAAAGGPTANLIVDGHAETASTQFVSGDFFSAMGIIPATGRTLLPSDDRREAQLVAVLGHGYWRTRFAEDSSVVGKQVQINGLSFTLVGVAGRDTPDPISGDPRSYDILMPLSAERAFSPQDSKLDQAANWWLVMMGRLKPGRTAEQVQANLDPVYLQASQDAIATVVATFDANDKKEAAELGFGQKFPRLHVTSAARGAYDPLPENLRGLVVMAALALIVLLVVCANLINLSLALTTNRERELSARRALGASRTRLIAQVLTEHVVVALVGGALSVAAAYVLQSVIELYFVVQFDWTIIVICFVVAVAAGLAVGALPAVRASRTPEGAPAVTGSNRRPRFSSALLVSQFVLSLTLLVSAGLFLRTLLNLQNTNPGFDVGQLLLFTIDPSLNRYEAAKTETVYEQLLTNLRATPGVAAASYSNQPLLGSNFNGKYVTADDKPSQQTLSYAVDIQQDFFATMGIPLRFGRGFDSRDKAKSPRVVVINEALARALFGETNPIGRRVGIDESKRDIEIVGVAADSRHRSLRDVPAPMFFRPQSQTELGARTFVVRTDAPAQEVMPALRSVIQATDATLPIIGLSTQASALETQWRRERSTAIASTALGGLTLVVSMIGLFGLMSYSVSRRAKEIAICMALGADRRGVLGSVLREALVVVVAGIVLGLIVSFATMRMLEAMLYGVTPTDPAVFLGAAAMMMAVGALAAYLPARRAASVAPMVYLRGE